MGEGRGRLAETERLPPAARLVHRAPRLEWHDPRYVGRGAVLLRERSADEIAAA